MAMWTSESTRMAGYVVAHSRLVGRENAFEGFATIQVS